MLAETFNSLYEIRIGRLLPTSTRFSLSILFMRFIEITCSTFASIASTLSILFMRFIKQTKDLLEAQRSFNSLYEIHFQKSCLTGAISKKTFNSLYEILVTEHVEVREMVASNFQFSL